MTTYLLITTLNSRKDILHAFDWEELRKEGLGKRFLHELDKKFETLTITPYLGSIRYEDIRCTSIDVFSYIIHYWVNEASQQVIILRVLNTRQKPIW